MTPRPMAHDYDGIEKRLQGLSELAARLVPDLAGWFDEYIDVSEYGLAVEIVAERLRPDTAHPQVRRLAAGLLDQGDVVRTDGGRLVPVHGISPAEPANASAHNLTVEGVHTYHWAGSVYSSTTRTDAAD
jgi:hypothetical protein